MTAPARHDPAKTARILAATEELVLKRGFKGVTIADVAERAHIGKGTVYLYWATKEDLFLTLVARSVAAVLDGVVGPVQDAPELVRPHRLIPHMVRGALRGSLVRALQSRDVDLLGAVVDNPRTQQILNTHGAPALLRALLPVWRRHGLIRDDQEPERQAYALQVLVLGYLEAQIRGLPVSGLDAVAEDEAIGAAVRAMLGERDVPPAVVEAAALEVAEMMRASGRALSALGEPGAGR